MTRTILVTGATGTVGSEVAECLYGSDKHVRIAVRDITAAKKRFDGHGEFVMFDFERPETWGATLADVDALFLMRPPVVGVDRIREFVDAAARVGVKHIVYLSVLGAEKNPLLPHRRIERHIERTETTYTFLRASFFMQNLGENHRRDILENDEIFVPAGSGKTSFVDARDIAAVAVLALAEDGHENRAYDITGAEALDYDEVADIFNEVLDRSITYPNPSVPAFVRRMYARGYPFAFIVVMVGIYTTARLGLAARVTQDVGTVLGRDPISMQQFVTDYTDTFKQ